MTDATALAAAVRAGQTTAREVMLRSLAACDAQAGLGAVVHCDVDGALAAAEAADALAPEARGPLHGLPFLVKDLGGVAAGLPAAAGSAALRAKAQGPQADSDIVAAFRRAGLVPFGLSATPPFGMSLSCEPEALPPTRNPWDTACTPGGSSGGAAAAVAAGIVAMAHATDAAGSIRVPAACCGLTGLKPSRGAIPGGPAYMNDLMGLVSELVLARSVRDVRAAFEAVRVPGAAGAAPAHRRIGVAVPETCGAAQRAAVAGATEALRAAGFELRDIPAPDRLGAEAHAIAWTILAVSLAEWLAALELADDAVPPLAATAAAEGRGMSAMDLFAVSRDAARVAGAAAALFGHLDAILMPTLSTEPPPVGQFDLSSADPAAHKAQLAAFAPNVALANVAGLPALALPFGTAQGMPVGVQLIGRQGSDLALLTLGAEIEARAPALRFPAPIAGLPS